MRYIDAAAAKLLRRLADCLSMSNRHGFEPHVLIVAGRLFSSVYSGYPPPLMLPSSYNYPSNQHGAYCAHYIPEHRGKALETRMCNVYPECRHPNLKVYLYVYAKMTLPCWWTGGLFDSAADFSSYLLLAFYSLVVYAEISQKINEQTTFNNHDKSSSCSFNHHVKNYMLKAVKRWKCCKCIRKMR